MGKLIVLVYNEFNNKYCIKLLKWNLFPSCYSSELSLSMNSPLCPWASTTTIIMNMPSFKTLSLNITSSEVKPEKKKSRFPTKNTTTSKNTLKVILNLLLTKKCHGTKVCSITFQMIMLMMHHTDIASLNLNLKMIHVLVWVAPCILTQNLPRSIQWIIQYQALELTQTWKLPWKVLKVLRPK